LALALTQTAPCCSLSLVARSDRVTLWQRWAGQPQKIWLRRALFQVPLLTGGVFRRYVLLIAGTGGGLGYSNELYRAATARPIISHETAPRLSDSELTEAATRGYAGYHVVNLGRARNPDQAVDIWLTRGKAIKRRLFDPRSGADLGESVPTGIRFV